MKRQSVPRNLRKQQGFLAVVAILIVFLIGVLGITITYMHVGSVASAANYAQSEQALFIAESGFEETARLLLTPNLSGSNARIGCSSVTSNANLTNTSVSAGTFTATTVASNPVYTSTTLSSALTSSASTIAVASTSGFAAAGRIMVDNEIINYGGISGNSFIGIQRGVNYSSATPHASGAYVAQFQCMVDVKGGIPNLTSPTYQREIQQAVPMQEAWAVGAASSGSYVLTRWNRPTAISWNSSSFANAAAANLNSVSLLSNADGWAVGVVSGSNFTLLHWTGSSWGLSTLATDCSNQDLYGVSTVYSNEAWAVGHSYRTNGTCTNASGTQHFTVLKWSGSSWAKLSSPNIPADAGTNTNLNAVHVIDTTQSGAGTLGFAVGDAGTILKYNGSTWAKDTSPTVQNLYGVYVVSSSEAWAVGAAGAIVKWNGTTWSTVSTPTATQLNSVFMLDRTLSGTAQKGWAVGNAGVAVVYNGTSWSSQNTGCVNNMNGVAMFISSPGEDVWAAGASGTIMHWNGSAWASVSSNVSVALKGISVIAPQQYPFAWKEVFP
jgi:Tfp pilus assembly protein PilX